MQPQLKNIIKIQGHLWLRMLNICQSAHSPLLSLRDCYFKIPKDIIQNSQNRRSGKKSNRIYETYKNTIMPHGRHIYAKEYDMENSTMCDNSQSDHALPHWKCVLQCCAQYPSINITDQESDDKHPNPSPSILFHIYHLIARCTKHVRLRLSDKKSCQECQQDTASLKSTKIYTRNELVIMKTTIYNFHTSFFIPEIQKLAFPITHVQILGRNHCGDSRQTAFKRHKSFQDVFCCNDYAERVVASFANQIKS